KTSTQKRYERGSAPSWAERLLRFGFRSLSHERRKRFAYGFGDRPVVGVPDRTRVDDLGLDAQCLETFGAFLRSLPAACLCAGKHDAPASALGERPRNIFAELVDAAFDQDELGEVVRPPLRDRDAHDRAEREPGPHVRSALDPARVLRARQRSERGVDLT